MLTGERILLRARWPEDVEVLQAGLYDDVETRVRADSRPWRPISPGSDASPYSVSDPSPDVAVFSVVEREFGDLAGEALLWQIDTHNRSAHLGISLLPGFRGRGLATDVLRLLCHFGFDTLGLHRLQLETLSDNEPMLRAARAVGFQEEGVRRDGGWASGAFRDETVLGLLSTDPA